MIQAVRRRLEETGKEKKKKQAEAVKAREEELYEGLLEAM